MSPTTHDRRRIALVALMVLVRCSMALWVLATPVAAGPVASRAPVRVSAIYSVIVVSGLARAFLQPARQALSAEFVPRHLFSNSITWRSGSWQLAAVLGPALGGVLYAVGRHDARLRGRCGADDLARARVAARCATVAGA